jgi:hypothetical protein
MLYTQRSGVYLCGSKGVDRIVGVRSPNEGVGCGCAHGYSQNLICLKWRCLKGVAVV